AERSRPIYITEGEKHARTLVDRGLLATTNPMGAGHWKDYFAPFFERRHIRILPDNDDAGWRHGQDVATILARVAASLNIVKLSGLPAKGDILDWLAT